MRDDNIYTLFSKSDKFYMRFLSGAVRGRRLDLWDIMRNYFENFRAIGMQLFSYDGIDEILQEEIEKRLFYYGRTGILDFKKELTAADADPFEQDKYDRPKKFTYTLGGGMGSGECVIGENGVYARNTFTASPTALICEQYALMLAHTDMSIICELVNGRFTDILVARNQSEAETASQFNKALYRGDISYIMDKMEDMEINRAVRSVSHLGDLLDTKDKLMKDIKSIFGIKKIPEKRERMITGEVEISDKELLFNLKDMLKQRKRMCDDINKLYGTSISVKCHIDIDGDGALEHEKEMEEEEKEEKADDNI